MLEEWVSASWYNTSLCSTTSLCQERLTKGPCAQLFLRKSAANVPPRNQVSKQSLLCKIGWQPKRFIWRPFFVHSDERPANFDVVQSNLRFKDSKHKSCTQKEENYSNFTWSECLPSAFGKMAGNPRKETRVGRNLSENDNFFLCEELFLRRVLEYVAHLHEHFVDPVRVQNGSYQVPQVEHFSPNVTDKI